MCTTRRRWARLRRRTIHIRGQRWDIIFTGDDPYSRPDPYRGQLVPYANLYAATPLAQSTFSPPAGGPSATNPNNPVNPPAGTPPGTMADGYDVVLSRWAITRHLLFLLALLLLLIMRRAGGNQLYRRVNLDTGSDCGGPTTALATGGTAPLPINYFYVIGNTATMTGGTAGTTYEFNGPAPG